MGRYFKILVFGLSIWMLSGCAVTKKDIRYDRQHPGGTAIPVYSGPRARVVIGDLEVKAPKAASQVGVGLRSMLAAAFVSSGRFTLVDPQALGAQSVEKDASQKAKSADVVVMIALDEFEPEASGGRSGIGGGGGVSSGILGGLLGTPVSKAHATLSIRIIDAFTSEVLASGRVEGQAFDTAEAINSVPDKIALGSGLSSYANTPMEKAIRIMIAEAVKYVSTAIPGSYYKY